MGYSYLSLELSWCCQDIWSIWSVKKGPVLCPADVVWPGPARPQHPAAVFFPKINYVCTLNCTYERDRSTADSGISFSLILSVLCCPSFVWNQIKSATFAFATVAHFIRTYLWSFHSFGCTINQFNPSRVWPADSFVTIRYCKSSNRDWSVDCWFWLQLFSSKWSLNL